MSAALTLCRGRSHDDYYFERPRLITAEPPPRPYVDVSSRSIASRIVSKEVLRRAFLTISLPYSGDNVHGEFGSIGDWTNHRHTVETWILSNAGEISQICRSILRRTAMDTPQPRNIPGFDILVVEHGEVLYIEVKGTGRIAPQFFMTEGEIQFSRRHASCFQLLVRGLYA